MKEYVEMGLLLDAVSVSKLDYLKVTEVVCKVPTADVAPVVHGKWVKDEEASMETLEAIYVCSACNNFEAWGETERYNYCPNCGARMDGENGTKN